MKELVCNVAEGGVMVDAGMREGRAEGEHGGRAVDGRKCGVLARVFVDDGRVLVILVVVLVDVQVGLANVVVGNGRVWSAWASGHSVRLCQQWTGLCVGLLLPQHIT